MLRKVLFYIFFILPTSTFAQDKPFNFELTPFVAYSIGGDFEQKNGDGSVELNDSNAQGLMFNIKANPNGQYEFLYSRNGKHEPVWFFDSSRA